MSDALVCNPHWHSPMLGSTLVDRSKSCDVSYCCTSPGRPGERRQRAGSSAHPHTPALRAGCYVGAGGNTDGALNVLC